jgi:hypothetical protein
VSDLQDCQRQRSPRQPEPEVVARLDGVTKGIISAGGRKRAWK